MSFENGVLISLPALELSAELAPASVFDLADLTREALSPRLRRALSAIETCLTPQTPRLIVARPEIFTHGESLRWLIERSQGVRDHLCVSDGSAVRMLPEFRNHVFFAGLGLADQEAALARLERRLPEVFTHIESQLNTTLRFRYKQSHIKPATFVALSDADAQLAPAELRPLVVNRHALEDSVRRTIEAAPLESVGPFERLDYVRLTEAALRRIPVAKRLLGLVAQAQVDPSSALVIVAPEGSGGLHERTHSVIVSLFRGGGRLPVAVAPNVLIANADLAAEALQTLSPHRRLTTDDSDDFWSRSAAFHEAFREISVLARRRRHSPSVFRDVVNVVYGPQARIVWLAETGEPESPP